MPRALALLAGSALGAASRWEEVTPGVALGLSTSGTWLALAFATGLVARRAPLVSGLLGAAALTAANGVYYATILLTEPSTPLTAVAGPPLTWIALGLAGGIAFGAAGALATHRAAPVRTAAAAGALLAGAAAASGTLAISRPDAVRCCETEP